MPQLLVRDLDPGLWKGSSGGPYFETLRAPVKGFYTFEHSGHSPTFEEPARAREILRENVLAGTNRLEDAR